MALQLGHRTSVDFDFFQKDYLPRDLLLRLEQLFKGFEIRMVVNHPEQLTVTIDGISTSFIRYPFSVISKPIEWQGVEILPALEIAAMKAYALGRRATLKDYVDLYFVFKERVAKLEEVIALCEKKYKKEFNTRLFLEQLVYSKDLEKMEMKFLKEKVDKSQIERFFEKEIAKLKV